MKDGEKFAIIINYHHLFKALLIAKEEKISCTGYGEKTRTYFSLNAFMRELIGYLFKTKASYCKRHLNSIGIYRTDDY